MVTTTKFETLTRTVADTALAMSVIAAPDMRDVYGWLSPAPGYLSGLEDGVRGLRVAYSPKLGFARRVHPEIENAVVSAVKTFERLGANVEEATPDLGGDPIETWNTFWWPSMLFQLQAFGDRARDLSDPALLAAADKSAIENAIAAVRAAGLPASIHAGLAEHRDHALTGLRFRVIEPIDPQALVSAHHHPHTPFTEIRDHLDRSALSPRVKEHAIGLFTTLAEAEAQVHGKTMDEVSFHELGEWDSIADMVGAAFLTDSLSPATWSVGSLPLGRGRVKTAHGLLPIPSPATTLLLKGFEFHDDGLEGERITPTGASILKYLRCGQAVSPISRRLLGTGIGFGTRTFPGISNVLRLLAFEVVASAPVGDQVAQIQFEIDDQSPEDLAIALDKLRAHPSVLDVLQTPAFGKKGRLTLQIRILAEPADLENVFEACFHETTTLGLRYQLLQRRTLPRASATVDADGRKVRVKVAERAGHKTAKIEADDLRNVHGGRVAREQLKQQAEAMLLKKEST